MIETDMDYVKTLLSNSDVLGSDDVRSAPIITKITNIEINPTASDKKYWTISLHGFEKKFKPCVTVRRIIDSCWGASGVKNAAGRYLEVYCDPEVVYHGEKTGGVRVSRVSHIDGKKDVPVKLSKTKKTIVTIQPITDKEITAYEKAIQPLKAAAAKPTKPAHDIEKLKADLSQAADMEQLKAAWLKIPEDARKQLEEHKEQCKKAINEKAQPADTSEPADEPDIP